MQCALHASLRGQGLTCLPPQVYNGAVFSGNVDLDGLIYQFAMSEADSKDIGT
jgi:hypothetical protein